MPGTVVLNQVPIDIYDADGNAIQIQRRGNFYFLGVHDHEQNVILTKIYKEIRKMNFYLSNMLDLESDDISVED